MMFTQLLISLPVMTLGQYSNCKRSLMLQEDHHHFPRSSILVGSRIGVRRLQRQMPNLRQLLLKKYCLEMVLLCFIWCTEEQILVSTVEQILALKNLTSYDYDAPIKESGDIDNPKFQALQRVIMKYNAEPHSITPSNKKRKAYGSIKVQMTASLFDLVSMTDLADVITSANPISMESAGQMFGFLLYESSYAKKSGNILRIPKVHDRAQVFVSCLSQDVDVGVLRYIGKTERWNNQPVTIPTIECTSNTSLSILVENMGRVNYGPYIFDEKGILSSVYLDGQILHGWKMIPILFHNLNQMPNLSFEMQYTKKRSEKFEVTYDVSQKVPALFAGEFSINSVEEIKDTYLSFNGWGKGVAFVNKFNIGRYWPSVGPQCNIYVPAPLLKPGQNSVVIFELESPYLDLLLEAVDREDFTCGSNDSKVNQV